MPHAPTIHFLPLYLPNRLRPSGSLGISGHWAQIPTPMYWLSQSIKPGNVCTNLLARKTVTSPTQARTNWGGWHETSGLRLQWRPFGNRWIRWIPVVSEINHRCQWLWECHKNGGFLWIPMDSLWIMIIPVQWDRMQQDATGVLNTAPVTSVWSYAASWIWNDMGLIPNWVHDQDQASQHLSRQTSRPMYRTSSICHLL